MANLSTPRARRARDARFAALAEAVLLAAGRRHITRADVDAPTAEAIATELAAIATRRDRAVAHAEGLPPSRRRGVRGQRKSLRPTRRSGPRMMPSR